MHIKYDYDWEGAVKAKIESGLSLTKFRELRAAEFSRDGKIPSYQAMSKKFRQNRYSAEPVQEPNLSIIDLSEEVLEPQARQRFISNEPVAPRFIVRFKSPAGTVIEAETLCPEVLLMKVLLEVFSNEL